MCLVSMCSIHFINIAAVVYLAMVLWFKDLNFKSCHSIVYKLYPYTAPHHPRSSPMEGAVPIIIIVYTVY